MADDEGHNDNTRRRDIQCSISEGKMMLGILKSIPSSEEAGALLGAQIRALKENDLMDLNREQCNQSSSSNDAHISTMASQSSRTETNPASAEISLKSHEISTNNGHSVASSAPNAVALYNEQVRKLDFLIEDAEKFRVMVQRLLDITKQANLDESTHSLGTFSNRFSDLIHSFRTLKSNHKIIQEEPDAQERLRIEQMTGFRDFLASLDRNFDSTKECFFAIYHIVKTSIEQGAISNSSGDQETGPVSTSQSNTNGTTSSSTANTSTYDSSSVPVEPNYHSTPTVTLANGLRNVSLTDDSPESSLAAQRAYLDVLKSRTASERDEIAKLLAQRDQLHERLASVNSVAMDVSNAETAISSTHTANDGAQTSLDNQQSDQSTLSVDPTSRLNNELEAKRHQLASLKSQLASLQEKQNRLHHVASALQEFTVADDQGHSGSDQEPHGQQLPPSISPNNAFGRLLRLTEPPGDLFPTVASTSTNMTNQVATSSTNGNSTAGVIDTGAGVYQQNNNDDPQRLYANMLEARIRFQEAVNGQQPGTGHRRCWRDGTSIAASQDQTTQATWGESPPALAPSSGSGSNSASSSGMGEGDDDIEHPHPGVVTFGQASSFVPPLPTPSSSSFVGLLQSQPTAVANASFRQLKPSVPVSLTPPSLHSSPANKTDQQQLECCLLSTLPQLGRSPSPSLISSNEVVKPTVSRRQVVVHSPPVSSSRTGDGRRPHRHHGNKMPASSGGSTVLAGNSSWPSSGNGEQPTVVAPTPGVFDSRLQRLETSAAYLHHLCQCLLADNAHLNAAFGQLLLQLTPPATNQLDQQPSPAVGTVGRPPSSSNASTPDDVLRQLSSQQLTTALANRLMQQHQQFHALSQQHLQQQSDLLTRAQQAFNPTASSLLLQSTPRYQLPVYPPSNWPPHTALPTTFYPPSQAQFYPGVNGGVGSMSLQPASNPNGAAYCPPHPLGQVAPFYPPPGAAALTNPAPYALPYDYLSSNSGAQTFMQSWPGHMGGL